MSLTTDLPRQLYTAAAVRALDRSAIEGHGVPGQTLMERAGAAAFEVLRQTWPLAGRLAVLCGTGNNGGDGYVVARLAHAAGRSVAVLQVGDAGRASGDAAASLAAMRAAGLAPEPWRGQELNRFDLLVDALLGTGPSTGLRTGLDRETGGDYAAAIAAINASGVPVLAIDIPSGLHADTGRALGDAVIADATVSFIGLKQGLFTGSAAEHCGCIHFADLDVPASVYEAVNATAERVRRADFIHLLARRRRAGHKGDYGHVLVVGGDHGYSGAPRMAAEAAARVGAGRVSVATRSAHAAIVPAARPEIMSRGVDDPASLLALVRRATVLAVGPGLGQSDWAAELMAVALECGLPMVADADALNLLAVDPARNDRWVLTPHPGEAARLLGRSNAAVETDRFAAARAMQRQYGGVCVLKGAGTIIDDGAGLPAVCDAGNPGMASGGMGDVLTGVIAGLIAQGLDLAAAAKLGVCLHAEAGDDAAREGERGLLASDLMPWLRRLVNP